MTTRETTMSRRLLAAGLLFTVFALSACENSRYAQEPESEAPAALSDSSASLRNRR
mgnify:CR=1 FL=1